MAKKNGGLIFKHLRYTESTKIIAKENMIFVVVVFVYKIKSILNQ